MSHKFKEPVVPDHELQRRTAEWIDSAVSDLERAANCAEGRACHVNLRTLLSGARQLAESIRKNPAAFAKVPDAT